MSFKLKDNIAKINEQIISKNNEDNNMEWIKNKQNDLKIIIRIIVYYKELKQKANFSFIDLNGEKSECIYIIDNGWLKIIKLFFNMRFYKNI